MLPKRYRLTTADFKNFKGAHVLHTPHFLLRVKRAERGRVAAVVSTAVAKRAVVRNTLRRRVYAVFEKEPPSSILLVVSAKRGAAELSFQEIRQEVLGALTRIA